MQELDTINLLNLLTENYKTYNYKDGNIDKGV